MSYIRLKILILAFSLSLPQTTLAKQIEIRIAGSVYGDSPFYGLFGPQTTSLVGKPAEILFQFVENNLTGYINNFRSNYKSPGTIKIKVGDFESTSNQESTLIFERMDNPYGTIDSASLSGIFTYSAFSEQKNQNMRWDLPISISLYGQENFLTSLESSAPLYYEFLPFERQSSIISARIYGDDGYVYRPSIGLNWDSVSVTAITAAPEPDTWIMLIIGFGISGIILRAQPRFRRRNLSLR